MVDFQSRDRTRDLGDDDDADEESADSDAQADDPDERSEGAGEQAETSDDQGEVPADASRTTAESTTGADPTEHGGEGGHDSTGDHESGRDHGGSDPPGYDDSATGHDHGDGSGHDHGHDDHAADHDHHAHDVENVGTAVVTVSSSRTLDDDPAGDAVVEAMAAEGEVVTRELVPDDHDRVQGAVDNLVGRDDVDVVVTTGGTGVTPDDVTIEAVEPLFEKELPGFGELFRILSHEEVGTKVVATRATAGIAHGAEGGVPVFCLPGSENAARLGAERIISEEAAHLAGLAGRE